MTLSTTLRTSCFIALICLVEGNAVADEEVSANSVVALASRHPTREQVIRRPNTGELQRGHHYNRIRLDAELSSEVFDTYLRQLDPQRSLFTEADIRDFSEYRYKFDDLLQAGDLSVGFAMHTRQ